MINIFFKSISFSCLLSYLILIKISSDPSENLCTIMPPKAALIWLATSKVVNPSDLPKGLNFNTNSSLPHGKSS